LDFAAVIYTKGEGKYLKKYDDTIHKTIIKRLHSVIIHTARKDA